MNARRGLGRGLGALIPTGQSAYREVPLSSIEVNPLQPRQHFDADALSGLADSIRQIGILQPIVVRATGLVDRFEIIAGERRWRAAKSAGLQTIPVVVRAADDESSLTQALIENVHRAELNPLEEAAAYRHLIDDFGVTHDELGRRMGRSRAAVTNSLRLLSLPTMVQRYLMDGELSAGHARALLGCGDPVELELLAERAVAQDWSVRAVEAAVRALGEPVDRVPAPAAPNSGPVPVAAADRPAAVLEVETDLAEALATAVEVQLGRRGGQIVIRFADMDDLGRLYGALRGNLPAPVEG